jgi:hypothetical protein
VVIAQVIAIVIVIEAGLNVHILPAYPVIVIAIQAGRVIGIVMPIIAWS